MSKTRDTLETACRKHLLQLEHVWIAEFGYHCCSELDCERNKLATSTRNLDLSTENAGQVAYSPDGVAPDDHKRRRRLTLGRYLSRQWGVEITAEIERGVNAIVAELMATYSPLNDSEFEVVHGTEVTNAYVQSVGARSCMVGPDNQEITDWFSHFPDRIGLVIWRQTEGRALLWTKDDGSLVLDRIYAGNHELARARYAAWCLEYGVKSCFNNNLPTVARDHSGCVTLGPTAVDGRLIPYLDSWSYATKDGRFHINRTLDCVYDCQETDGCVVNGGHRCERCEERVCPDDAYSTDGGYVCDECYSEYYTSCDRCQESCLRDDTQSVGDEWWCEGCAQHYAMFCAGNAKSVGEESSCESCVSSLAGGCPECGSLFPRGGLIEVADTRYCCGCCPETNTALEVTRS